MYLTEINKKSGFLLLDKDDDGLMAIQEFREVINDPELGIPCMTCIALVADYKSPLRFYGDEDRPKAAMEEITGNRQAFVWNQEKIQKALKKYDYLQYDPTIEEGRIHYQRKVSKLKQYKFAEENFGKNLKDENDEVLKIENPSIIAQELRKINSDIQEFEKLTQGKDIYENSPTRNGYKLSRLEQKLEKKQSFYTTTR